MEVCLLVELKNFPAISNFKPSMIICAIMLYFYWQIIMLVNSFTKQNINYKFKMFGILSAVFLVIHSIFLGIKFDIQIYKLFRRVVLLLFIIFEIIAQGILVYNFFKLKEKIKNLFNYKILKCKILLVSTLSVIGLLSIPLLVTKGNTHIKHALEWNFFLGVILFYLLTRFLWRRTT